MKTALVVDDLRVDREVLSICLRQEGFVVLQATCGEEAIALIASQPPDIIVLDIVLPDRSGFELCRDLKDDDATRTIPVVMCSTKGTELDKFWGMKQGADAYITKPLDPDEVVQTVQRVLR